MGRSAHGIFKDPLQLRFIQDMIAQLDRHDNDLKAGKTKESSGASGVEAVTEEVVQNKYATTDDLAELKITPGDFQHSDSGGDVKLSQDGSYCTIGSNNSDLGLVAKPIPTGYRAITVIINGSQTYAVKVYRCDIDSQTSVAIGSGEVGTEIGIDNMDCSTNYIGISVHNGTPDIRIYGGKIRLQKI